MVSYASDGGGSVRTSIRTTSSLIQVEGRRRWQYGFQRDLALVPGTAVEDPAALRGLARGVLEPGDMLYLPQDGPMTA